MWSRVFRKIDQWYGDQREVSVLLPDIASSDHSNVSCPKPEPPRAHTHPAHSDEWLCWLCRTCQKISPPEYQSSVCLWNQRPLLWSRPAGQSRRECAVEDHNPSPRNRCARSAYPGACARAKRYKISVNEFKRYNACDGTRAIAKDSQKIITK